jgi:hypothetical protein
MAKVQKKKRKTEIQEPEEGQYVVKRYARREPQKTVPRNFMVETARETLQRLAPDEVTAFRYAIPTRIAGTEKRWYEWLGDPRRVSKNSDRALKMFDLQAQQIVQAIIDSEAEIVEEEYKDEIPFCDKHR